MLTETGRRVFPSHVGQDHSLSHEAVETVSSCTCSFRGGRTLVPDGACFLQKAVKESLHASSRKTLLQQYVE